MNTATPGTMVTTPAQIVDGATVYVATVTGRKGNRVTTWSKVTVVRLKKTFVIVRAEDGTESEQYWLGVRLA